MSAPITRHLVERAAERLQAGLSRAAAVAPPPADPPVASPAEAPAPVTAARRTLGLVTLMQADLQVGGHRRSRIAEEYMVFSAQLMRARQALAPTAAPPNLVMVTSTQPGEGKSFTAINLAASLAQNGHTGTVLIDGDPKRNSMTERLGISDLPGLFDMVADPGRAAADLILPTAIDNFAVLPIGDISEQQGFAGRAATLLHRLARQMPDRLLILDAPPCRATSDPSLWSSEVGQVVMVVEAARTQRHDLERAIALLQACPNIALMLNKTRFDLNPGFGAYGYYGA